MQPSTISPDGGRRTPWRTFADSFIIFPAAPEPWCWFPPAPEPPRPPMAPADLYGALLQADTYSEQARDALRAGDDDAVRNALEVLRGIVAVALGQISSSENRLLLGFFDVTLDSGLKLNGCTLS